MIFFEKTLIWVLLGLFVVSLLLVRRLISGGSVINKPIVFTITITAALIAASWLMVTPREQIAAICRDLGRWVDDGNVNEIEQRLASDFETQGMDRDAFVDRLNAALSRIRLDHVRIRGIDVSLENEDRASSTFHADCNIRSAEGFAGRMPSRWRLRFIRQGDQWLLKEVESIPIPPMNLRNPFSLLHSGALPSLRI